MAVAGASSSPSGRSGAPEKSMQTTLSTATGEDPATAATPAHTVAHRPSRQSRTATPAPRWVSSSSTPCRAACRSGTKVRWMSGAGARPGGRVATPRSTVRMSLRPARAARATPPRRAAQESGRRRGRGGMVSSCGLSCWGEQKKRSGAGSEWCGRVTSTPCPPAQPPPHPRRPAPSHS